MSMPQLQMGGATAMLLALGLWFAWSGKADSTTHPYPAKSDSSPHPEVARAHRMAIQGIDVSRWQGDIDWRKVASAGTRFAFIKATEGGDYLDPKFATNWIGARQAGIPRGAYHFMYWCRPVAEQAAWFVRNVPPEPSALPPVLDVEWNSSSKTCPRKVPRAEALVMIQTMLHAMAAHSGKRPIIYTDITFHKEILEGEFPDYPFWLRSVAAEPNERYGDRQWMFWQFTTTGRVPGIVGPVDRNAFSGEASAWAAWQGRRISKK
ncbi:MAG: glycoside hydrolase [Brevundimonas diminuta]|nr:MAG: glycoside hydrolase [Brevundimonas diminuta]